jgi:hypothetical protein
MPDDDPSTTAKEKMEFANELALRRDQQKMELAHELARAQLELSREWMRKQVMLSARGQWMATVLAVLCIAASVAVTLEGHDWVGGVLGGSTVVSLATVFIVGQATKKEKPTLPESPKNPRSRSQ